jgi:hypothetical protein
MTQDEFEEHYAPVWKLLNKLPSYSSGNAAEQLLDKLLGWKEEGFLQVDHTVPLTENQNIC